LEVGETWTFTYNHVVTSADLTSGGGDGDGKLDNTATAESFDPHFGPISASAEIPILLGPGVRTPGFWSQNTGQNQWTKFWDGIVGNEPKGQVGTDGFPKGELTYLVDSNHDGTADTRLGLLIGDFSHNGKEDPGEHTLFISLTDALQLLNASQKQQ